MTETSHTMIRTPLCPGGMFTAISAGRFKTGRITLCFLAPLSADTASAYAMVPHLLRRSSAAFPDFIKLNERLAELYGAALFADVQKIGEVQCLSLSVSSLDDRYTLEGETISAELAGLLCNMVLEPAFGPDGLFRKEDFEQEQRQLMEKIEAEQSDKRAYAKKRCIEEMCAEEAFGVGQYGTAGDIAALTPARVKEAWAHLLRHARIEVFALSNGGDDDFLETFRRSFSRIERAETEPCETLVVESCEDVTEVSEAMALSQAKLVLGLRAGTAEPNDNVVSTFLMNAMWGGTPHSKLFVNVREKMSLCYYCTSRYDRNKGIILVECGIEKHNKQAAQEEILHQLQMLQSGDFSDEELENTKLSMTNNYRTMTDTPYGLVAWMIHQSLNRKIQTVEEAVEQIRTIQRSQIVEAAKRVTLDTVYFLSEGEEQA